MHRSRRWRWVLIALVAQASGFAAAQESSEAPQAHEDRLEELERRVEELEASEADASGFGGAEWARYVRLAGSADAGFFDGERNSGFDEPSFQIWDARFFIDANLDDEVRLADRTVFRNLGFTFEWDLVRLGDLDNRVGELYADFQGVFDRDALNFQVGRFQLPVGEAYLRYSRGYAHKPFLANPVGAPWWWDEGIRLYGSFARGRVGYVSAVSDGDTAFNADATGDKLVSLKLYAHATPWLYLSASALRTGKLGSSSSPASGALWLGESWARAFGSRSSLDNFHHGEIIPDGPNRIDESWFVGADVVADLHDALRLWLAGGRYDIDSSGPGRYDRVLYYWIAEVVLEGGFASPLLRPFYLGLRANALATYDENEGYLLDAGRSDTLGYNMESLTDYAAVLGWVLNDHVRIRAEYTHRDIGLVSGVTPAIRHDAENANFYVIEVGVSF